ncbi:clustered mitochondria protein homolog [Dendropsophus ebraccatus]|uniref:clustered mitochondria protein homolog n=1 Tax=Dendropsophus ebraccatus TaxID=150705 RepID=UPI0038322285
MDRVTGADSMVSRTESHTPGLSVPAPHDAEEAKESQAADTAKVPSGKVKSSITPAGDTARSQDLFYLTVQLPGGDSIEIQVSPKELVQEIIQVLMEHEDSCHRTCFSLQFDGNVLDNFSELKSVEGLKEGCVLKVVEEPYTIREARIHIRHFRDLLKSLDLTDAYNGVDCSSLSFLSSISEGDIGDSSNSENNGNNGKKKKRSSTEQGLEAIDCSPPEYILPGSMERPLQPLQPISIDNKTPQCLKSLIMSGWNPPPGNRKMHGDLLYLTVVTMEDHHINITSSNRGFYINQSTAEVFNPKPASPSHLSHNIVELLNQVSPAFKKNFSNLQKKRVHRHPLERIATPYQIYSWIAPSSNHIIDCVRAEDAYNSRLGYEEHIPGQMRDWNEELQTTRELSRENLADQQLRQRANFKINSDFVGASTRGAMAVIDGNVMAINPGEETKMQMYIWNNIFFSFGFDVRDHYKDLGGDHAAHVAATHDLKGVQAYSDLDIEELYVLGTVVLDYRGYRVTAQSIIPGILDRKEDQSVVYGSIDFGKTVSSNVKYLTLLQKASKPLRIMRHTVLNAKNEEVLLCSSVECKGIVGNDGRHYILDLLRTFPPDVNFLPLKEDEVHKDCQNFGFPKPYHHRLCSLRPELMESFVQYKYAQFMKVIVDKSNNGDLLQPEINGDASTKDDLRGADIVKEACREIGSVTDYIFDIRFNPDVYSPVVRFPDSQKQALEIQKRLLSEAASFLLRVQIPNFIKACLNHIIVPLDGKTLKESLHAQGINIRYLGTVAETIDKLQVRPSLDHLYRIIIIDIVTRSAKIILRSYLQGIEMSALSAAVSHFLNCFLSSYPNPVAHLPPDELLSRKRKNKKKIRSLENGDSTAWASMTPTDLWKQIQQNAKGSFDFTLSCDSVEQLVEKFTLQKVTLLREFCMKTGVQVLLREYNFESRHKPALTEEDILNMFPVVKNVNIKAKAAHELFTKAQISIQQGGLKEGVVLLNEALVQFNSVYGAVHPDIAMCLRLLARVKFILGDAAEALDNQQKAVIMTERTLGYESSFAVQDYVLLAHYCFASGQLPVALKLLYRARYLMLVIAGEDHPTMATLDSNIGVVLQAVLECDLSLRFLEKALEVNKKYFGLKSLDVALSHHLIALAYTSKVEFRSAMQHEKETFTIYKALLGDCHERTRESSAFLKHVTQQAVNLQRTMNEIYKNGAISSFPHVQIVPPGVDTLLQQLNLLNGILRITAGITDQNSKGKQIKNQNSTDRGEETLEPISEEDHKEGTEKIKEVTKDEAKAEQQKGAEDQPKDSSTEEDKMEDQPKDASAEKEKLEDQPKDASAEKEKMEDQPQDASAEEKTKDQSKGDAAQEDKIEDQTKGDTAGKDGTEDQTKGDTAGKDGAEEQSKGDAAQEDKIEDQTKGDTAGKDGAEDQTNGDTAGSDGNKNQPKDDAEGKDGAEDQAKDSSAEKDKTEDQPKGDTARKDEQHKDDSEQNDDVNDQNTNGDDGQNKENEEPKDKAEEIKVQDKEPTKNSDTQDGAKEQIDAKEENDVGDGQNEGHVDEKVDVGVADTEQKEINDK